MDWIVAGVAQQAGKWMLGLIVLGVGIGAVVFLGLPWLWSHVSVVIR